jgi:hypothetical protein
MILRTFIFLVLLSLATFLPTAIYMLCALVYALFFTAYELIILAVFIDAYYGLTGISLVPYYTLITAACLLIIEWIKPHISVYTT